MGEARRVLFGDPDGDIASDALPDVMSRDAQLLWFGGLAGAARLGWDAPHFQSRTLTRRLGRISVPVLVLRGDHDALVPAETARAWVDGLPSARLGEVAGAGHCLPLERPDSALDVLAFVFSPTPSGRR
jgi:pimeloyl-ACP methyl ester carboxylesterase